MLVSVIIPTYNYAQYISEAIESILTQENFDGEIEIIVVDDGSTDTTPEVVNRYGSRVQYIRQENQGKAKATQVGIASAKGKYLFNLDADDFFMPTRISKAVKIFEHDPEIVHVAHPALWEYIDESTQRIELISANLLEKKLNGKDLLKIFYKERVFYGGGTTFAVRTETMKKILVPIGVDMYTDEFLGLAVLNEGFSYFIAEPLSVVRAHSQNFSRFIQDKSVIAKKMKRLLDSSVALNDFVQTHDFEVELKRLFAFSYAVRKVAFEEEYGKKTVGQVAELWKMAWHIAKPWETDFWKIVKNYTLINRSLPSSWLKSLKKLKNE
ncbi:MAG: glycosyltransferase family 2 protein [Verrucomicrobia bacterium]|nr:glycosyltransferase family 2 protein [Cytophagales bacterium]